MTGYVLSLGFDKKTMNETLNYYNKNADKFVSGTIDVEFTEVQDKFLA